MMFSAQFQQQPVPLKGNYILREWFRFFEQPPALGPADRVVQSWDIASAMGEANDYSVCTTWHMKGRDYYLIDVFRGRLQYPALRREIASLAIQYGAEAVLIEDAGPGMTLLQDLRHDLPDGMPRPIGQKPEGSKLERMMAQSAKIEAGHVHLRRNADWLDIFLLEFLAFPHGRHDDQVDSTSQFLKWAAKRRFLDDGFGTIGLPIG